MIIFLSLARELVRMSYLMNLVQDDGIRKITKKAEFFEPNKFTSFTNDLHHYKLKITPDKIIELNIKCSGYGYYQEEDRPIQTLMKRNLISYLQDARECCKNLRIFKLDLSGFSISDNFVRRIIKVVGEIFNKKQRRQTIWLHTRFLRDCQLTDVTEMLQFTDYLVRVNNSEEISIMLSGWQFKEIMNYHQFTSILQEFSKNLKPNIKPFLKRLKIDISSWYMHNLEAYNFLSRTVPQEKLAERLQNSRHDASCSLEGRSVMKEEQLIKARKIIKEYLQIIDRKYQIQNPISTQHPTLINFQEELKAQRLFYFQNIIRKGISPEELKKLALAFKDLWGQPQEHKTRLQQIQNRIRAQYQRQKQQLKQKQQIVEKGEEYENYISQRFVRFPFEQVIKQRVIVFHLFVKKIMSTIYSRLLALEEFQWDMRNWNPMFSMGDLKKELNMSYGHTERLKIIQNPINGTPKLLKQEKDQQQQGKGKGVIMSFIL